MFVETLLAIFVGVLSGVFANLATSFFVAVVLPSYRDYVYHGFVVAGDWVIAESGEPADGHGLCEKWHLSATLQQKAYVIKGHAIACRTKADGTESSIGYELSGHIYDRIVSLTFRTRDSTLIAHSTFLIEVTGNGSEMTGYRAFYGLQRGEIRAVGCVWRKGGDASVA